MLKELSVEELEVGISCGIAPEVDEIMKNYASRIKNGEKLKAKQKTTKSGTKIIFYKYDKELYRYIICGEFWI